MCYLMVKKRTHQPQSRHGLASFKRKAKRGEPTQGAPESRRSWRRSVSGAMRRGKASTPSIRWRAHQRRRRRRHRHHRVAWRSRGSNKIPTHRTPSFRPLRRQKRLLQRIHRLHQLYLAQVRHRDLCEMPLRLPVRLVVDSRLVCDHLPAP